MNEKNETPTEASPVRVRAKFKVDGKEEMTPGAASNGHTIRLTPVYSGSLENSNFYKWTPGGQIVLSTISESAAAAFEVGKEYYVDFTPAG